MVTCIPETWPGHKVNCARSLVGAMTSQGTVMSTNKIPFFGSDNAVATTTLKKITPFEFKNPIIRIWLRFMVLIYDFITRAYDSFFFVTMPPSVG